LGIELKTKGMSKTWLNMADYVTNYQSPYAENPLALSRFHSKKREVGNEHALRKLKVSHNLEELFGIERKGLFREFMKTMPAHRVYLDERSLECDPDGNWSVPHGHYLDRTEMSETQYQEYLQEHRKVTVDSRSEEYEEEIENKLTENMRQVLREEILRIGEEEIACDLILNASREEIVSKRARMAEPEVEESEDEWDLLEKEGSDEYYFVHDMCDE
jgi:hypothetical protein